MLSFGQTYRPFQVPVRADGMELPIPFAGGLDAPQFNNIDLNRDGRQDLLVLDRSGYLLLPFIRGAGSGSAGFSFAPEFRDRLPAVKGWLLVRDYNGDEVPDLFAWSSVPGIPGVEVYQGRIDDQALVFDKVRFPTRPFDLVYFPLASGGSTNLYVSEIDIPEVADMDGDGDLDILTFNLGGGYVELYANQSVERGYGTDTLIFEKEEDCWGGFYESGISMRLDESDAPGDCYEGLNGPDAGVAVRHTGSTLLTIDMDGDCDREIFLGDISFDNILLGRNGGTCSQAWINDQDTTFPSYDVPVNIASFPASFFVDVDNDGNRDFLAAKNASNGGEDYRVAWYYRNTGSDDLPVFQLQQKDFLTASMIDLGSGAHPAIVDYNSDGWPDLVVGNESFFTNRGLDKDSRLFLYENTGHRGNPGLQLVNDNWLDLGRFNPNSGNPNGIWGFTPAFGDLDSDGDIDLVLGNQDGSLILMDNIAGPGNPVEFGIPQLAYKGIDVGRFSTPAIQDVDGDGLADLVVGEENVRINFFKNIGSPGQPEFHPDETLSPNTVFFGRIDLREGDYVTGFGTPAFLGDGQDLLLAVGNDAGSIRLYGDVAQGATQEFLLLEERLGNVREGERVSPAFGDFDRDGLLEMVVGNARGGIGIYRTNRDLNGRITGTKKSFQVPEIRVFPNPVQNVFSVELPSGIEQAGAWELFDLSGNLLVKDTFRESPVQVEVGQLPGAVYILRLRTNQYQGVVRILKVD